MEGADHHAHGDFVLQALARLINSQDVVKGINVSLVVGGGFFRGNLVSEREYYRRFRLRQPDAEEAFNTLDTIMSSDEYKSMPPHFVHLNYQGDLYRIRLASIDGFTLHELGVEGS